MKNNVEILRNHNVGAMIKGTKLSRLHIASTNRVIQGNASNATALITLPETAGQRKAPQTTIPTTTLATIPTAPTTQRTMENIPHAVLARKQTILRTDASTRRFMNKLKRQWQQRLELSDHLIRKCGEPLPISAADWPTKTMCL